MADQYDVIVIGAGNGGMVAAAYAAKAGLKTLLLEKHNLPGGCATSFRRGRFEFEVSLHELCEYGEHDNAGTVRKIFDELELDVNMGQVEDCFRVISPPPMAYDVIMPVGREKFIAKMEEAVPGSAESTRKFFELADETDRGIAYLASCNYQPDPEVLRKEHPVFMKLAYKSVDEVLDAIEMPKKAQSILTTYWTYICIPTSEYEFPLYANMVNEYVNRHAYIANDRTHGISLAFDKRIRDFGGEIWYNSPVDKILVKDGKAYGVQLGDRQILAKKIIADINPHLVYGKMIDGAEVPERALKLANAREHAISAVTVYYGLNKSAEELGITDYSRFINRGLSDEAFERFKEFNPKMIGGVMNCPNIVYPDYSEKGTCVVWGTTLYRPGAFDDLEAKDYRRAKISIAIGFAMFYKMTAGIDILPYIEEVEVATPVTFARYLNTPGGSIYGYQGRKWDNMIPRMMTERDERYIDNLLFCGGHASRLDGYCSAYNTGHEMGLEAIRQIKEGK